MADIEELKKELSQIDLDSLRSIRAILTGSYTAEDMERLVFLERKASLLRARLITMQRGNNGKRGKRK